MAESIIECKPRPRHRVFVKLSGGRFFTIPESEAGSLRVGNPLSDEEIRRLSGIDQYLRGKEKALRLLSIRPRTLSEIRSTLEAMGIEEGVKNGVLKELEELGLLDDRRFARDYIRAKVDLKRFGPHRLRFELRRLGVQPSIVETALEEALPEEEQERLAWDVVEKKLGSAPPDTGALRRLGDLLKRKGFDFGVVNRVLYELLERSRKNITE